MKQQNEMTSSTGAMASWTAAALWRFGGSALLELRVKSGRGLPQSKTWRKFGNCFRAAICAAFVTSSLAAALPSDWQHEQSFSVPAPGLVKLSLPPETLDAARPALEDLRLYDAAGNEVPYLIGRPVPAAKVVQPAKSFHVALNASTTVVTLETGLAQPLDGVTFETPAINFIKSVRVDGSADGNSWQALAQGQPIFRQPSGAGRLHVSFPASAWRWLRLTVDDQRSQAIPFTGARVHAAEVDTPPGAVQPVAITERNENPGETRLTLNLGAAHLDVASVKIETDEPLFTRTVTFAVPQIMENGIREQVIGQGLIYRVAVAGQPASANLSVPLEQPVPSRELVLLIKNGDSPPLPVSAVRVDRRPVYLVFLARSAGMFHLLTGNKFCAAARYDLAAPGVNLKAAAVLPVAITALADNPDYHAPEALAGVELSGALLDVSGWKYRKAIGLSGSGAQQVELDLDVLAHASPGFADLRLLRGSNQVPFLVQRTSINRSLTPTVTATNDTKNPHLSRWILQLPRAGLPLTRLTCVTKTPLFQREMSLYEELTDERGDKYRHLLGGGPWTQTPEHKMEDFSLPLNSVPQSDTLVLETQNGDNPPIELEKFAVSYPATRVLFKAKADDRLLLYYGNPRVSSPSYDLSLVAGELLAADKVAATAGAEEQLKKSSWAETQTPGSGGMVFWGILALVVVGLLVIITRLLPKAQPPPAP